VFHTVRLREGEEYEWSPDLSRASGVIRGVLHGPDGGPVAGMWVCATRIDPVQQKQELSRGETDADGRFELTDLRPFPHTLTVHAAGEPFANRPDVPPDGPEFVWRLPALPSQCGSIVGRLLGADGQPVADAKYRASSDGITRGGGPADSNGFLIPNLLPGTWRVLAAVHGYGSFDLGSYPVTANAPRDIGTLSLPPRGTVLVRVTARGFVPADIALELDQAGGWANRTKEFAADAGGMRSPPLPPGTYRLVASGTNFAPTTRTVTIPPGGEVAIDLDAAPATTVAIEFVPEEHADGEWHDNLRFEVRDARGELVWKHAQEVRGAPSRTFAIGLAAGAYTVDARSVLGVSRHGRVPFAVPSDATGKLDVRVLLAIEPPPR
jgi:hypothetical protein